MLVGEWNGIYEVKRKHFVPHRDLKSVFSIFIYFFRYSDIHFHSDRRGASPSYSAISSQFYFIPSLHFIERLSILFLVSHHN